MIKLLLLITTLLGATGVITGAFGAHVLENKLTVSELETWKTAVQYQLIHVVALLALLVSKRGENFVLPAWFLIIGILLFSGSLYLLSSSNTLGLSSWKQWLGPVTPIGGLSFIIGWLLVFYQVLKW